MMRARQLLTATIAVATLTLAASSSASAAVAWVPQNVNVIGTSANWTMTDSNGGVISCPNVTTTIKAVGAVATAQGAAPMVFANCTNTIFPTATTTVTSAGTFTFTALNVTTVDLRMTNAGGNVLTVVLAQPPLLNCTITVPNVAGGVAVSTNTWNNATHVLTLNSMIVVGIQSVGCMGVIGNTAHFGGSFQFPNTVTIM